jgi:hypothetical protein
MLYPVELRNLNNVNDQWSIVNSLCLSILNSLETKFTIDHSSFVIPEGLEPSTFDVSGRCSNHLSYEIVFFILNSQSSICFACQFLIYLWNKIHNWLFTFFVIPERFELSTPGLKDRCSNHLSYEIVFMLWMVNRQFALPVNFEFIWNKIHYWPFIFCNLRRTRTFNFWFRRPTLYPIEPWDYF